MADSIEVARADQIPLGTCTPFTAGGKDVALFNVDGTIYAIADTCLHTGGSP